MKNEIEIELRGRLDSAEYEKLLNFLKAEAEFKQDKERVLLDYSTFLEGEEMESRTKDIRLRVTNKVPEIVTKLGGWGGNEHREEISILCEEGSFDRLVQTYAVLGYTKAVLAIRKSKVYTYQDYELSLVEVPGHSYYFEIESLTTDEAQVESKKKDMRKLCDSLDLTLCDDTAFFAYVKELNEEANEVFEFKNYTKGYFKDRFNL